MGRKAVLTAPRQPEVRAAGMMCVTQYVVKWHVSSPSPAVQKHTEQYISTVKTNESHGGNLCEGRTSAPGIFLLQSVWSHLTML